MQNLHRIPVLLLTGYLGSGKTTLVNHILTNKKGIRFAVIVNDIGEVNIDASLIQKGGIVGQRDESLVALSNGCICCTLKMDLVEQLNDIIKLGRFDYIVIEASGICEPEPIARTICSIPRMGEQYTQWGLAALDCIVTVVDALRMQSEFDCGHRLLGSKIGEEDLENLLIQQVEFCNIVLLNKVSEVEPSELERLRLIIKQLNPMAKIVEADYADVDIQELTFTGLFTYGATASAAGWIRQIDRTTTEEEDAEAKRHHDGHEEEVEHEHEHEHHHHHDDDDEEEHEHHHHHHDDDDDDEHEHEHHHHHDDDDDDEHEHEHHHHHDDDDDDEHEHEHHHHHDDDDDDEQEHEHHHHHHHHHGEGEAEEYGISTFVYYRRQAFDIDKFDRWVNLHFPKEVIRAKGICYFSHDTDMSFLFEQAGVQIKLQEAGQWYATMPEEELIEVMRREPGLVHDWDEEYGDRMQKIVFIGQKMDREKITRELDQCLV